MVDSLVPAPIDAGETIVEQQPEGAGLRDSDLTHLRRVFFELKKGLKMAMFNRHRPDFFEDYAAPAFALLGPFLDIHRVCELKLEVSTFMVGNTPLIEDDSQESNIIYPLWATGIRLLTFKRGLAPLDLLRFFMAVIDFTKSKSSEDLATHLWKQEFKGIDWIVVTDFEVGGDDTGQKEIEIQVEKVLAYLQQQLSGDSEDSIGFARVSIEDLDLKLEQLEQVRQSVRSKQVVDSGEKRTVQSEVLADERDLLRRICKILLEVMKMESSSRELKDLEQALEQLFDALILDGQFGMVDRLLQQCVSISGDAMLPTANRHMARTCHDRLFVLMHEGQRVRAIGIALNLGRTKDHEGLRRYLMRFGPTVIALLLDLQDTLEAPAHRRILSDVLVAIGQQAVPMFAQRLTNASSNLAKDLLYIIDKINPPDKVKLFAPILKNENAVLRMEGLTTIGRTKDEPCFAIIRDVLETHEVPQMRAHAARIVAEYPAGWAEPVLLEIALGEKFKAMADGERRAIIGAIAKLGSPDAQTWLRGLFAERSGLLKGRKLEDKKLMGIAALLAAPSAASVQQLIDVAKDEKQHSKEVRAAAHAALTEVKKRLHAAETAPEMSLELDIVTSGAA